MISSTEAKRAAARALGLLKKAGIALTPAERKNLEVADFGLGELERTGLQIVVYENNDRYCAKELVLFPGQTCPQHRHPPRNGKPGKRETFRCRWGRVYLYLPGPRTAKPKAKAPKGREASYTAWHEVTLDPGEQFTVPPDTPHWFQGGPEGAIVSEFSSASDDASDIFQDGEIQRVAGKD
jgi:D-lyxose ketol-isomerase